MTIKKFIVKTEDNKFKIIEDNNEIFSIDEFRNKVLEEKGQYEIYLIIEGNDILYFLDQFIEEKYIHSSEFFDLVVDMVNGGNITTEVEEKRRLVEDIPTSIKNYKFKNIIDDEFIDFATLLINNVTNPIVVKEFLRDATLDRIFSDDLYLTLINRISNLRNTVTKFEISLDMLEYLNEDFVKINRHFYEIIDDLRNNISYNISKMPQSIIDRTYDFLLNKYGKYDGEFLNFLNGVSYRIDLNKLDIETYYLMYEDIFSQHLMKDSVERAYLLKESTENSIKYINKLKLKSLIAVQGVDKNLYPDIYKLTAKYIVNSLIFTRTAIKSSVISTISSERNNIFIQKEFNSIVEEMSKYIEEIYNGQKIFLKELIRLFLSMKYSLSKILCNSLLERNNNKELTKFIVALNL